MSADVFPKMQNFQNYEVTSDVFWVDRKFSLYALRLQTFEYFFFIRGFLLSSGLCPVYKCKGLSFIEHNMNYKKKKKCACLTIIKKK